MAGSDSSAEIKALLVMVAISLAMGGGVLIFKSDYRTPDIWRSNIAYYPNVRLPEGDSLRAVLAGAENDDSAEDGEGDSDDPGGNGFVPRGQTGKFRAGRKGRTGGGSLVAAGVTGEGSGASMSGEASTPREPTLAETLAAAAAEFRKGIGQPRPDLEGADGEALYAQEFDGDRVLTEEAGTQDTEADAVTPEAIDGETAADGYDPIGGETSAVRPGTGEVR